MHTCPLCNGTGQVEGDLTTRLIEARKAKGVTQAEACKSLGISRAQLANIESGRGGGTIPFIRKAAKFYEVSADYLIGDDDE